MTNYHQVAKFKTSEELCCPNNYLGGKQLNLSDLNLAQAYGPDERPGD